MSTKSFLIIVALVAVLNLMTSGCSEVSYASAPTDTPVSSMQEVMIQPTSTQPPSEQGSLTLTMDDLAGTWYNGEYIEFKPNGAYAVYTSLEALQAGDSLDEGGFGIQGDQLWLGPMSSHCNGMGFYQLTNKSQNEIELTKIREECSRSLGKLQRVSP